MTIIAAAVAVAAVVQVVKEVASETETNTRMERPILRVKHLGLHKLIRSI